MLIKQPDDRSPHLMELERIKEAYPDHAGMVDSEMLRIYLKDALHMFAESADLHLGELSNDVAVLHDLRLSMGEQVVEIDHLLINRSLQITLVDSGFMGAERVKVNALGEVFVWSEEGQEWVGVRRAFPELFEKADLLEKILAAEPWPRRLGMRLSHSIEVCLVLADDDEVDVENVSRWGDRVFKLSEFVRHYERERLKKIALSQGLVNAAQAAFNRVNQETLQRIAQGLADLHEFEPMDYMERWGLDRIPPATESAPEKEPKSPTDAEPGEAPVAKAPAGQSATGQGEARKGTKGKSRRSGKKGGSRSRAGQKPAQSAEAQQAGMAPSDPASGTSPGLEDGPEGARVPEGDEPSREPGGTQPVSAGSAGDGEPVAAAPGPASDPKGQGTGPVTGKRGGRTAKGGSGRGAAGSGKGGDELLPSSRIAASLKMKTPEFLERMRKQGFLQTDAEGQLELTDKGRQHGGRSRGKGGNRSFSWPREIKDLLK
ncbi:MAG: hypothetical protein ACLFTM_01445 [Ectothiorhodospira sp.]